jgi:hypothetical protein
VSLCRALRRVGDDNEILTFTIQVELRSIFDSGNDIRLSVHLLIVLDRLV